MVNKGIFTGQEGVSKVFVSTEQTGNGSEQSIAHGLAATPTLVLVVPTGWTAVTVDIAEGTHDVTNVKVTITNAITYKVIAFA